MIELLGSIGWGLLACGAITHVWHHGRLRELVAMHLDHERPVALAITAAELLLAIAIPLLAIAESELLQAAALAATLLAVGFFVWIARLLATGSDLPCACSFSAAPTSIWSLLRAACVGLVVLLVLNAGTNEAFTRVDHLATFVVGWAIAAAIFVLPEALGWPESSRALMARVEAHTEHGTAST